MSSRKRTTVWAVSLLVVSMAGSIFLLNRVDRIRPHEIVDDTLYIASPKLVKHASLGFEGLVACIYWTRAVQYFGHLHFLRNRSYNELAPLLEITTTLDPNLAPAYQFGASFLAPAPPNGAGQPERAIRLMEYGIQHNPDNWHLYYDLGFIYYTELKDYKRAGEVFARGSKVPNAHPFLKILAAVMAEHAEDFATARLLWSAAYESSTETNIRQNALEHLRSIQVDEDVTSLQNAVTQFVNQNGRIPTSLWEVADAEHLKGVPVDPDGVPFELSLDGQVLVANPDDFPFISKGTPPGYKPGPPKFHVKPPAASQGQAQLDIP
jgi:tetratricopeptide (TPR) repeat protein